MTHGPWINPSTAQQRTLADVRTAAARVDQARANRRDGETAAAMRQLQNALDDARDANVKW